MGFKRYYKENAGKPFIKTEADVGDFGDDAQDDAVRQAEIDAAYEKPEVAYQNVSQQVNKNKRKWAEARGFIKPDGKMERIGDMRHEDFARDLGYPIMVDGKMITKKFSNSKMLGIATGLVRWSPETNSFSVFQPMTLEQMKVIKEILKAYGYKNLMMDFLDKSGALDYVEFDAFSADPAKLDAKLMGVNSKVNDKKLGQR